MTRWPWLTMIAAIVLAVTPPARELFYDAFISSDRWMQDFLQLLYLAGVAVAIVVGLIEWGIRTMIVRRRARAQAALAATGEHMTES
jgi:hypothetical protein